MNEAGSINTTLARLSALKSNGHEIIIVDGGSTDRTLSICERYTTKILKSEKGRAKQMNVGAKKASNKILVFLHADTLVPIDVDKLIQVALQNKQWGFFKIKLSGKHIFLRMIEFFMNLRSRLSGVATGDQVIFVYKEYFELIHGFKDIPLMEDVALSKSLKKLSRPVCVCVPVISSSRRWEKYGYLRTILLMWFLRLLYFLGVSPSRLVKLYD